MEFCSLGALNDILKLSGRLCLSERETAAIVKNVLAALEYLHAHSKMHRDVKPDNILLTSEGEPKLGTGILLRFSQKFSRFWGCWKSFNFGQKINIDWNSLLHCTRNLERGNVRLWCKSRHMEPWCLYYRVNSRTTSVL